MNFSRSYPPAKFVQGVSLAADYLTGVVNAHEGGASEISFTVHIYSANSPSGSLYFVGSNDRDQMDSSNWPNSIPPALFIDPNRVQGVIDGAAASFATAAQAIAITSATDDSHFTVSFVDGVPLFMAVFFDRTAGGAAGIDIGYSLKG